MFPAARSGSYVESGSRGVYDQSVEESIRELTSIGALLSRAHGKPLRELQLERRPLRGGLEASSITRVRARYRDALGHRRMFTLVVKRLVGTAAREAMVYERLVTPYAEGLSPRVLASEHPVQGGAVLYLEALRPVSSWPWQEVAAAQVVLERVAAIHSASVSRDTVIALAGWDYEAELNKSAELTLEHLERAHRHPDLSQLRRGLSYVRRVVGALEAMRHQLLAFDPLGKRVIHGDLHSGNVVLRRRKGRDEPVFLDWGRARIGSPLEDVSCWLQSLRGWEPEARRRHDTLLASYMSARGMDRRLGTDLRAAYWLAGASNALSGALLYQLTVGLDERQTRARRARGFYAARQWLRVLRQADACWS
jgi:hypothetical protein